MLGEVIAEKLPDPFQNDIPFPDPFVHAMHVPVTQKGRDLEMMHDFLKRQCRLLPLPDQQQLAGDLPSQNCSLPYVKSDLTSNDTSVLGQPLSQLQSPKASLHSLTASLSETKSSLATNDCDCDKACLCRCILIISIIPKLMVFYDD
jgi:hypothetical protein